MNEKRFRVQFVREGTDRDDDYIATSISVVVPDGLDFHQAKDYAIGCIVSELSSYAVDEALRAIGMETGESVRSAP